MRNLKSQIDYMILYTIYHMAYVVLALGIYKAISLGDEILNYNVPYLSNCGVPVTSFGTR